MPVSLDDVRAHALSLPDTTEEPHHVQLVSACAEDLRHRAAGRALLHVFLPDEQRDLALALDPAFLEPLIWGSKVMGVRVHLPKARRATVLALVAQAYATSRPQAGTACRRASAARLRGRVAPGERLHPRHRHPPRHEHSSSSTSPPRLPRRILAYSSVAASAVSLGHGDRRSHVYAIHVEAGGEIGRHRRLRSALPRRPRLGLGGGSDGVRHPSPNFRGVHPTGEQHAKGSETGMVAIMVQSGSSIVSRRRCRRRLSPRQLTPPPRAVRTGRTPGRKRAQVYPRRRALHANARMPSIALFGATGHLGRHLARQALDRGWRLSVAVRDRARLAPEVRDRARWSTSTSPRRRSGTLPPLPPRTTWSSAAPAW